MTAITAATASPRLLDRVRQACRLRHYSPRTGQAYTGWIRRYMFFHNPGLAPGGRGAGGEGVTLRHLAEMGAAESSLSPGGSGSG